MKILRSPLPTLAALLALVLLFASGPLSREGRVSAAQQIVVVSWGGVYQEAQAKAFFEPFERETGIKVVQVTGPSLAKVKAMVQSNNVEWDVVDVTSAANVEVLARGGFLEPIDYGKFDAETKKNIRQDFLHQYAVATDTFSLVLAYSMKKFQKGMHPQTWADFWDVKKFPGPRAMFSAQYPVPMAEIALLADGVRPDKLYPIDLDRAFRALDRLRPHVVKWTPASGSMQQLLADGEAVMAPIANGRVDKLRKAGVADNDWTQPILDADWWAVPKGNRNREAVMRFVAFASKEGPQAEMAKASMLGPVNQAAFKFLEPALLRELPTSPDHMKQTVIFNAKWWANVDASGKSNIEKYVERWESWSTK